ncbi:hypothetical protein B9T12_08995 [Wohlfahrtiimonas chitiniclastica]|uniref:hypothetical protein n=1 Tax=Wohlfahrtiimonas chitiniclastica TaxID=400946 RepID=UPI000B993728|nr:hypothetical protein [Wohlfahrtiimonas chitiniclastica]OYQ77099.1 hypothetical protein B9T12_08995 [Wohlfahrtiimonas chitiniclastica]
MSIICVHTNQETSHLLCSQYWERVSVTQFKYKISDICAMHNITRQELTIILSTYPITLFGIHCSQCLQPYPIYSRTHYLEKHKDRKYNQTATCKICKSNNKLDYTRLLQELHEKDLPQLDNFPYELIIQIYAGLQYLQQGKKYYTGRFKKNVSQLGNLSENSYIQNRTLQTLSILNLIFPATAKDFELLQQSPNNLSKVVDRIHWQIVPNKETLQSFMNTIQIQFINRSRSDYKFIHEALCYDVAYYECLQYLHYRLRHHKCTFSYAEGTRLVIHKGLAFFSVAQMYYLIYRAAKQGSTLGTSKEHAGKLSVGLLEKLIDSYASNPEQVEAYKRITSFPQSHINNILFDKVYEILDCGFNNHLSRLF